VLGGTDNMPYEREHEIGLSEVMMIKVIFGQQCGFTLGARQKVLWHYTYEKLPIV